MARSKPDCLGAYNEGSSKRQVRGPLLHAMEQLRRASRLAASKHAKLEALGGLLGTLGGIAIVEGELPALPR